MVDSAVSQARGSLKLTIARLFDGMGYRHRYTAAGLLLALLCTVVRTDGSASYNGPAPPVNAAFFGMHIHRAAAGTAWPAVSFAGWRLWDAGVSWPELEPVRGKWDFSLLDQYTRIAAEHHVEILLTLGLTPTWASARPREQSSYRKGNAAQPQDLTDWEEYVRVVATRYKGVIHNYEVWNEPNVKGTFTGNAEDMLQLSRAAYSVLKSVDPGITVVSAAPTSDNGVAWLDRYLELGACHYADVIGYHFYVTPHPPEAMIALIQRIRTSLNNHNCGDKPIWNTESGWTSPKQFASEQEAAGYVMRTYVLNWLMGVQRCYWYAWDNRNWSTLDLTSAAGNQMTKAGAAYATVREWMVGASLHSCARQSSGVWTCNLNRADSTAWIVWTEQSGLQFQVPADWQIRSMVSWTGQRSTPGPTVTLGPAPLLLVRN